MSEQLTKSDISTILESFKHSKMDIREGQISPYEIKQEHLRQIEDVEMKLRAISNENSEADQ